MSPRAAVAVPEPAIEIDELVRRAEELRGRLAAEHRRRREELEAPTELELLQQKHQERIRERHAARSHPEVDALERALALARAPGGPTDALLELRRKLVAASGDLERELGELDPQRWPLGFERRRAEDRRQAVEQALVDIENGLQEVAMPSGPAWQASAVLGEALARQFGKNWWESWRSSNSLESVEREIAEAEERREQAIARARVELERAIERAS